MIIELRELITEQEYQQMREESISQLKKMNPNFDKKNLKVQWIYDGSIPVFYAEGN